MTPFVFERRKSDYGDSALTARPKSSAPASTRKHHTRPFVSISCILALACGLLSSSQALAQQPRKFYTDRYCDLGVSIGDPYCKWKSVERHLNFSVDLVKLRQAALDYLAEREAYIASDHPAGWKPMPLNLAATLLDAKRMCSVPRAWQVCMVKGGKSDSCLTGLRIQHDKDFSTAIIVVDHSQILAGKFGVRKQYVVKFDLQAFLADPSSRDSSFDTNSPMLLIDGEADDDEETKLSSVQAPLEARNGDPTASAGAVQDGPGPSKGTENKVSLGGREISVGSDFSRTSADLVTSDFDTAKDKYVHRTAEASLFSLKYSDPLVSMFGSPLEFSIDSTLSDQALDSRSAIELRLSGYRRFLNIGTSVNKASFVVRTSQSLHRVDVLADLALRWGDRRGMRRPSAEEDVYFAPEDALTQLAFDVGFEAGQFIPWHTKDVHFKDSPSESDPVHTAVRPYLQLNFTKLGASRKGPAPFISGTVRELFLDKKYGGASTSDKYVTVGNITLGFKNKNKGIDFGVDVKFGTNPSNGFQRIKPTFGISYTRKY